MEYIPITHFEFVVYLEIIISFFACFEIFPKQEDEKQIHRQISV